MPANSGEGRQRSTVVEAAAVAAAAAAPADVATAAGAVGAGEAAATAAAVAAVPPSPSPSPPPPAPTTEPYGTTKPVPRSRGGGARTRRVTQRENLIRKCRSAHQSYSCGKHALRALTASAEPSKGPSASNKCSRRGRSPRMSAAASSTTSGRNLGKDRNRRDARRNFRFSVAELAGCLPVLLLLPPPPLPLPLPPTLTLLPLPLSSPPSSSRERIDPTARCPTPSSSTARRTTYSRK